MVILAYLGFLSFLNLILAKIECDPYRCLQSYLSDDECDYQCNNELCGFDQLYAEPGIYNSDCSSECFTQTECKESMLDDGICDEKCNTSQCGYDWGDCGFCRSGCFERMLGNGICDEICNSPECSFDDYDCLDSECSAGCKVSMINDKTCQVECQVDSCNFDGRDCDQENECSFMCDILRSNRICDEICNSEECDWDGGECQCSPGCTPTIRKDKKVFCSSFDPCNTQECGWHNGKCGYCNEGCFEEMLSNGICDKACEVKSCNYDSNDCKLCSPGCDLQYPCQTECMTRSCNWGEKCYTEPNKLLFKSVQALKHNWDYIDVETDCKSTGCELQTFYNDVWGNPDTKMFFKPCMTKCDNIHCAYNLGGCYLGVCASGCSVCHGPSQLDCILCYRNKVQLFNYCVSACPNSYVNKDYICVYNSISTEENPDIYYISQEKVETYTVFQDLTYALAYANGRYQQIRLSRGEHQLKLLDHTEHIDYYYIPSNSPLSKPDFGLVRISIEPWMCDLSTISPHCYSGDIDIEDRPIIHWNNMITLQIPKNARLTIKNVNLYGKYSLIKTNVQMYDDYCPFLKPYSTEVKSLRDSVYEEVKDQRGQIYFIQEIPNEDICKLNHDKNIIQLEDSQLVMENVKVSEFRMEPNSIVKVSGQSKVILLNVDFYKIRVSYEDESAVISFSKCSDENLPYECGEMMYEGGKISGLNDGYELDDSVKLSGFIYVKNLYLMYLKNLSFEFCLINSQNSLNSGLINLGNFLNLTIDNCRFLNSVFSKGIVNFLGPFLPNISQGNTQKLEDDFITHILLTNLSITDCYSSNSLLLDLSYTYIVHNIHIENISINTSIFNSLLKIQSQLNSASMHGGYYWLHIDTKTYLLELAAKQCTLKNIKILNSNTGSFGIIESEGYGNILIDSLEINSELSHTTSFESIIREPFKLQGDLYLKNAGMINHRTLNLARVNNFNKITLENVTVMNHTARQGSGCLILGTSNISWNKYVEINNSKFSTVKSLADNQPAVLFIIANKKVEIKNSVFENNLNESKIGYGAVQIESIADIRVSLENNTFFKNKGGSAGALFLNVAGKSEIKRCIFEQNSALSKSAGAVYIIANEKSNAFYTITESKFISNSANTYGGACSFENSKDFSTTITLNIQGCTYEENSSILGGSALSLMRSIQFEPDSNIQNSLFLKNKGSIYGTIYLENLSQFSLTSCTFESNQSTNISGIYITSGNFDKVDMTKSYDLSLTDSTFSNNLGEILISQEAIRSYLHITSTRNSFINNKGTVLDLYNSRLIDDSSRFMNNSGEDGTAIKMYMSSISTCKNSIFERNRAQNKGGAVYASRDSGFNCWRCEFVGNSGGSSGGVLYVEQSSYFKIEECEVSQNISEGNGSAVYMVDSKEPPSEILNSKIMRNKAESGTIHAHDSSLVISGCVISNNTAIENPGLELNDSDLNCTDTIFSDQTSLTPALFILSSYSNLSISNSEFTRGTSSLIGAIGIAYSNLNLTHSTFTDLESKLGAAVYAEKYSNVYMSDCVINSTSGTFIGVVGGFYSNFTILNTVFENISGGAIYGEELDSLSIEGSRISRSTNLLPFSQGIVYCLNCAQIKVLKTHFESNIGNNAGAVCSIGNGNSELLISDSYFLNNTAFLGGAIHSKNTNLTATGSYFKYNNALVDLQGNMRDLSGKGGAIFLSCEHDIHCTHKISESSFYSNTGELEGGALKLVRKHQSYSSYITESNNIYAENIALYGNDRADTPETLYLQPVMSNDFIRNIIPVTEFYFPSGQELGDSLRLSLLDYMNDTIISDTRSTCKISIYNSTHSASISGATEVIADNGEFVFPGLTFSVMPSSNITLVVKSYTYIHEIEDDIELQSYIPIHIRDCYPGEHRQSLGCFPCGNGTYSLTPDDLCRECPENAVCLGRNILMPDAGYWKSSGSSDKIWKCLDENACLGGNGIEECEEGYKSNLCQSCQDGYGRTGENQCSECGDDIITVLLIIADYLILFIAVFVLTWFAIKDAYKKNSVMDVYLKILTNYYQMILIMKAFNLNWIGEILQIFAPNQGKGYTIGKSYSLECWLGLSNSFYTMLVIYTILPLIIAGIVILGWFLAYFIFKLKRDTIEHSFSKIVCTLLVSFFYIHPSIIEHAFEAFSCREIEEGEYWLNYDLSMRCWDEYHIKYIISVSITTILLWGILTPALTLFILIRNRKTLNTIKTRLKFGLLYFGFSESKYYWEFIILYRKVVLIALSVFLGNYSTNAQALTILFVLVVYLYLQFKYQPYYTDELNLLEIYSILVSVVTIYAGLYYLTVNLRKVAIFVLISSFNLLFIQLWVKRVVEIFIVYLVKKYPKAKKFFKRLRIDSCIKNLDFQRDSQAPEDIIPLDDEPSNPKIKNITPPDNQYEISSLQDRYEISAPHIDHEIVISRRKNRDNTATSDLSNQEPKDQNATIVHSP